jgi:3-oxoacyl-[acyl-carrier protein] reductase
VAPIKVMNFEYFLILGFLFLLYVKGDEFTMKTAIVTGGTRGIGKAIVYELVKNGFNIVLNYKNSDEIALKIKNELGEKVQIFKADVSKRDEVKNLINFTLEKFKNIDVLVNNAGIAQEKMFIDLTDEDWDTMIQTNLTSAFYTIQEVLPTMIHNKNGCIINISSIWGITGASCEVHYSASKAGLDGLSKGLAKELGPSNIRVNSVAPGAIMTDMNKGITEEEIKEVNSQIPLGTFGKPEDIAKCVVWLVNDEYTTGQVISPNGGWVI